MYPVYSFILIVVFLLMSPLFLLRRQKYAAGFRQRLGNYPEFKHDGRKVIWLHCVSVGETNAARPLVDELKTNFPNHRIVVSTTTLTGQNLARDIFKDKADAVFYFPFDWKFTVRKALANYKPSVVLLMETEIWPRFIHEAKKCGARIAIVNGRLSAKSFARYSKVRLFITRVLADVDLALMQAEDDWRAIIGLGMSSENARVSGNLKFDLMTDVAELALSEKFRRRFGVSTGRYLIVAASTHAPEEKWLVEAFGKIYDLMETRPRLLIAPRHPERFDDVAMILKESRYKFVRRSAGESAEDKMSEIILLDSIGELRAVYPLADLVFVGGSLVAHGGQSVLEPAAAGKAIVTGSYTHNFRYVVKEFLARKALIQLPEMGKADEIVILLSEIFENLLRDPVEREFLGYNAANVMKENAGATKSTVEYLRSLVCASEKLKTDR